MMRFKDISMQPKLITLMLLIGVIPLAVVAWLSTESAKEKLLEASYNQLTSMREVKRSQIERFFDEREGDLKVLAETATTLMEEAFNSLEGLRSSKKLHIESYFNDRLGGSLNALKNSPLTSIAVQEFQQAFKRDNTGISGDDWKQIHQRYHSWLKSNLDDNGYYDIFLISLEGDVVYSVSAESDLGENLKKGSLKNSGLADAFNQVITNGGSEFLGFADYKPYAPSNGDPAAFVAGAIKNENGAITGVAAIQISLEQINTILNSRAGLGETGEIYLVGPDYKMRSNSFLDPAGHSVKASFAGSVEKNGADTEAVRNAIKGKEGADIIIDYNGNPVLSAYAPVNVFGTRWAVIAEIDVAEAFVPVNANGDEYYKKYIELYGYYDLFLILNNGYVFYSAAKESDYKTNMVNGQYKNSGLGELTRRVIKSKKYAVADFAPYAPSNDEPAAFAAAPVMHPQDKELEMVVAVQLSLDAINTIMQEREGMGETGETYLVGSDKRMRSDSFLDPKGHSVIASFAGSVQSNGVDTEAANEALAGRRDAKVITDYNGNPVLSSYTSIEVGETRWALLAEIDEAEVMAPIEALVQNILMIALIFIAVIVMIAFLVARTITNPIMGDHVQRRSRPKRSL